MNFNGIAPFYDSLSKIVFGKALLKARICFLDRLPESGTILYIGGGSGIGLKDIRELNPKLKIDFIEASYKFISIAKTKFDAHLSEHINFIHGTENSIDRDKKYTAVITFFIIDLFPQKEAEAFCKKIISHLEPGGIWLFTDFISPPKKYQKLLLKFIYSFFRIVANMRARTLPDYDNIFSQLNMKLETEQLFHGEMICSKVLRKALSASDTF